MKLIRLMLIGIIASSLAFTACKKQKDDTARTLGMLGILSTSPCMGCHSATTELGQNIRWAQAGWDVSVHKQGMVEREYACTAANTTTGACTWVVAGYGNAGSDAFYANGGSCQVCHTNEGFLKKVQGTYAAGTFDGSDAATSWGVGTVDASKDIIGEPSPQGCFTCHEPHTQGNMLPRTEVANGTIVTTPAGGVYGSATADTTGQYRGALCATCHVARMGVGASKNADAAASVLASSKGSTVSARIGPHHGPMTDMLLGKAGYQVSGQSYSNGSHSGIACTTCHFGITQPATVAADEFAENTAGTLGGSQGFGGHSFNVKGIVHGAEKINVNGCNQTGCHAASPVSSVNVVATATSSALGQQSFLRTGDAYPKKGSNPQNIQKINELMAVLADPDKGCDGLLRRAIAQNFGALANWSTFPDQATLDGRCVLDSSGYYSKELVAVSNAQLNGAAYGLTFAAVTPAGGTAANVTALGSTATVKGNAANTATSAMTLVIGAIWNYNFVMEDKSWGHHNMVYAQELLWDTIVNLSNISTGVTGTFTGTTNVTKRP